MKTGKGILGFLVTLLIVSPFQGCSILLSYPDNYSQSERMAFFQSDHGPVRDTVKIYWDQYSIPFLEAKNDEDLAFGIGTVHAHLRLGQLEILRYLSQGRVSELIGPLEIAENVDRFMRTIDFTQAAVHSIAAMSEESKVWMEGFTEGINWYIAQLRQKPIEHRFFNLELSPFSVLDAMTIVKFIGSDLSWLTYVSYLRLKEQEGWEELFKTDVGRRDFASSSITWNDRQKVLELIKGLTRSGSNSLVIHGGRTESGAGMIASDPHVGLFLPNFWVLMGLKSPGYHAIGLMIPGVPFLGVGRNRDVAWGGTNMRGISSHLYLIPEKNSEKLIRKRTTNLQRRWWFSRDVEILDSDYGPVINTNEFLKRENNDDYIAIDWVGQRGSDEILSFLKVSKARNWEDFRQAFSTYSVSAMNILYTDTNGNIGMVPAYGQPLLKEPSKTLEFFKELENPIVGLIKPTEQPNPLNPAEGFIASANNKPFTNPVIPYGFMYASDDRFDRLKALMDADEKISVHYLMKLQQDVYSAKAKELQQLLIQRLNHFAGEKYSLLFEKLSSWDGRYNCESEGAVVFEVVKYYAWLDYLKEKKVDEGLLPYWRNYPEKVDKLQIWIGSLSFEALMTSMRSWLEKSSDHIEASPTWGDFQIQPQRPFLGMIPVVGKRFSLKSYPAEGGEKTLNKSGRKFSPEPSFVTYGASARHISDMDSLNENYFVLHGGQDGWIINENLADQTQLWREGKYIKVPLSMERVRETFNKHLTIIHPQRK